MLVKKEELGKCAYQDVIPVSQVGTGKITDDAQVKRTEMGVANGVATLDSAGKVPAAQLSSVGGGSSKWSSLTASTDFSTTAASTSTITMLTDQTTLITTGMALNYTIGGTKYYGVVTAITSSLMTIAGAPLSGTITELQYSIFPGLVETVVIGPLSGYWSDSADTSLILNDLCQSFLWSGPPAYLVRIQAFTRLTDTGASFPRINARIGATTTNYVSTSNSNAGLALLASATWYSTVVDIMTSMYAVINGQVVELTTDGNGENDNATDLTVILTFVYA